MKRLMVSMAAVALLALGTAASAAAAPPSQGWGPGGHWWGYGGSYGNPDYSANPMLKALADKLGMSANDLASELRGGKSVVEVAATKNVAEQTLMDLLMAPVIDSLKLRVQYGYMTQQQADAAQKYESDRIRYMLNQKGFLGMPGWGGYMMGHCF